jgi:membrane-bound serine protease (ClpP class)
MRRLRLGFLLALIAWPLLLLGKDAVSTASPRLFVLEVSGPIGPATSDFIHRGLTQAREQGAAAVILQLDTPGGLDTAMRKIIQDILASPVPVVTYVAPSGARAASAGTYILLASHVAAMAPATNIGAATPVRIGGVPDPGGGRQPSKPDGADKNDKQDKKDAKPAKPGMDEKALNDAIAYIRGLAQMRGRNAAWAEKAVREAASLPAEEAVRQNVADFVAHDLQDLARQLHGRRVTLAGRELTLSTKGAELVTLTPDWRSKFLSVITDPNIAYILMLLGIYGIFFELWNPGFVLPGVVGGICLLLALYAFQVLPINYAGLALILLGVAFMVAEVFVPSFGALGIGGVIAFVVGSVILLDTDVPGYSVALPLIIAVSATSAAFFLGVVWFAVKARRRRIVSGAEELMGAAGEALDAFAEKPGSGYVGRVRVHSEEWQARARQPIKQGEAVAVVNRDGLTLEVEPKR